MRRRRALRHFPFTTWLRLARVIEGSQTVALLVAAEHLARSSGGVTIAGLEAPGPGLDSAIARDCWRAGVRHRMVRGGRAGRCDATTGTETES